MWVAMAGLPGTGKSTIARRLAGEIGAVVLDKDVVRRALFPPPALDHSAEQDDLSMAAIYRAATSISGKSPAIPVVIDGRTFRLLRQVQGLFAAAEAVGLRPKVIECVCAERVVRFRLEADLARGGHPAGNRTFEMYRSVKATAEPLAVERLVLDTDRLSPDECVRRCREYLGR